MHEHKSLTLAHLSSYWKFSGDRLVFTASRSVGDAENATKL